MAVEQERGCGYRKVGGLYLCGEGHSMVCDRLPYELEVCPVCGSGVKFSRGFQWLDWLKYAGMHGLCTCPQTCPICWPTPDYLPRGPYGLLWVGEAFYTPESFIQEALEVGVSRRIAAIPRSLKFGETWILLAHKKAFKKFGVYEKDPRLGTVGDVPGIFYAFRPRKAELLIWKSEATEEKHAELVKRGITPIIIPNGDVDHDPRTSLKPKEEERNKLIFGGLRESIRRARE